MTRIRLPWLWLLVLAPVACSDGAPVDLGHGQAQISDFAASWDGYAEAYTFPDGSSDSVRLVLDATGEGTLEVGDAPLDPTPTDPNVPLPGKPGTFHDGFRYPIHAVTVEAGRIRFEIYPSERFAAWCAIQVPYPFTRNPEQYVCVEINDVFVSDSWPDTDECRITQAGGGTGSITIDPMIVSCNRYLPCINRICACTSSSCAFDTGMSSSDGYRVRVDGTLETEGARLVGTLVIQTVAGRPEYDQRITIRLRRQ